MLLKLSFQYYGKFLQWIATCQTALHKFLNYYSYRFVVYAKVTVASSVQYDCNCWNVWDCLGESSMARDSLDSVILCKHPCESSFR